MQPPPAFAQDIIDAGEPFDLVATFTGSGTDWINMKRACLTGLQYQVRFYAEGQGANAPEIDFGMEVGNLSPGVDKYVVTHRVASGISTRGLYQCSVTVEFPQKYGVLGYYQDLWIQVSPREQ